MLKWRNIVLAAMWLAGLWLLNDSFTFALQAPDKASGTAGGCYTFVERVLGRKHPSDAIRATQTLSSAVLSLGIPTGLIAEGVRKQRRTRRGLRSDVR